MKKVISAFLLLIILAVSATVSAAQHKAAIVISARDYIAVDEKIQKSAQTKAAEIFPAPSFEVVPLEESNIALAVYCEENGLVKTEASPNSTDAVTVMQPLKQEDLKKLGGQLGCDFLLYVRLSNSEIQRVWKKGGFGLLGALGGSRKQATTITSDVRIFSVTESNYLFIAQDTSDINFDGSFKPLVSHNLTKGYRKSLDKALVKITVKGTSLI